MRKLTSCLVVTLVLTACGGGDPGGKAEASSSPEMLAVAVEQLITEDHTFGQGPPPFTEYLIQTQIDAFAGDPTATGDDTKRTLTPAEQAAIEEIVTPYGPVRWIDDPDEWRTPELTPTVEGAVILGVGEPVIEGETGLVPVSLWCGGLCGTWLTYRLVLVDEVWEVTGVEGPVAVS
ncbi:MAG: hypothetical protein WBM90_10145 [Acidimicrobiia bacterium]